MVDAVAKPPAQIQVRSSASSSATPLCRRFVIMLVLLALNGYAAAQRRPRGSHGAGEDLSGADCCSPYEQTYVIYAGDIDLSVGAIVSLVNVVIVASCRRWAGTPSPSWGRW